MKTKIEIIRKTIELKEKEIEIINLDVNVLRKQLHTLEYVVISWDDLYKFIKENRPDNNVDTNPSVKGLNSECFDKTEYCYINSKDKLVISGFYHKSGFPRGEDLRVHHDFKNYK